VRAALDALGPWTGAQTVRTVRFRVAPLVVTERIRDYLRAMRPDLRLRARISLVVGGGALLVAIGVALLLANTVHLRDSSDAAIRSDSYLVSVAGVERLVVDAETGLRGYVLTGRPVFLSPTRAAQQRLPAADAALLDAAKRERAFVVQAQALAQSAQAYMTGYLTATEKLATTDRGRAQSYATTLQGKTLVDGIRGRTQTLEQLVSARETARQRAAHTTANHAIDEAIAALVLLTLLTIAIGWILGRLIVDREHARARSERTASTLQQSLLPTTIPPIPGCELAARFTPEAAGDVVGGDFYDVFPVADKCWALVVGDVCGKGAQAAAVTAMARWTLRSYSAAAVVTPAGALRFLNEEMLRHALEARFITVAYMLLTVDGDQAEMSVACAGHPAPILVPSAGEPTAIEAQGTLLGVWPELSLQTAKVRLNPGDGIVAFTDGVTDQGPESMALSPHEAFRHHGPDSSAEDLAKLLERYAHSVSGVHRDDIAILAMRFRGSGRHAVADGTSSGPGSASGPRLMLLEDHTMLSPRPAQRRRRAAS
jgi:serine phosphatase RsbU (regulator of sigma subunit)